MANIGGATPLAAQGVVPGDEGLVVMHEGQECQPPVQLDRSDPTYALIYLDVEPENECVNSVFVNSKRNMTLTNFLWPDLRPPRGQTFFHIPAPKCEDQGTHCCGQSGLFQ